MVLGFPWRRERLWRRQHEVILEAMRRWPRRSSDCARAPPGPGAAREVERCLAAGFRGVGELAWYVDDPGRPGILPGAPRGALPSTTGCHSCCTPTTRWGRPIRGKPPSAWTRSTAIKTFPETTWILAHWGGGLPFYGLLKKEAPEVLRRVYFDTAASPYLYRPAIYRLAAEMVGPEKILFGSDFPLLPPKRYLKEMAAANLPGDWQEMILGQNLARLLNW